MTTLIIEPHKYSEKAITIYKNFGPVFMIPKLGKQPTANQKNLFKRVNILVVRLVDLDKKFIDMFPNLRIIACPMTGLDHIDTYYAKKTGIEIISLKGKKDFLENIPSTAEETIGLIIALLRKIPYAFESVKKRSWKCENLIGNQISGKTLGLIGFGRLGKIVASYGKVFKMNILANDPYVSKKTIEKTGIKKVTLKKLLKESDIISLHVTLTNKTSNLIKEEHFRMMKPSAVIINTARGEIIDEKALIKTLKNKWISGAAIDVMKGEHRNGSHLKVNPLLEYAKKHHNLIIMPHVGGFTQEAMAQTEDFIAESVKSYIYNKPKILGVIPARGGSKGVPRKNIKSLAGKPLIYHIIQVALGSKYLTRVVISSEDEKIIKIAKKYGAEAPFKRPKTLARDRTPSLPVVQHAVKETEKQMGIKFDYVVLLQATSPFTTSPDIDKAIEKLIKTKADSVVSVYQINDMHPVKMKKIINDRLFQFVPNLKETVFRRQDLSPIYKRNGGIYATKRDVIMKRSSLYGRISRPYIMPPERSIDIDSKIDFWLAEEMIKRMKNKCTTSEYVALIK